jgi:fatty-acid desaturase
MINFSRSWLLLYAVLTSFSKAFTSTYSLEFLCRILYTLVLLHVRFPWQPDGALSRNNGIVQHCCVSLATQQYWTALASLADNNVNKQHCYARNSRQAFLWYSEFY